MLPPKLDRAKLAALGIHLPPEPIMVRPQYDLTTPKPKPKEEKAKEMMSQFTPKEAVRMNYVPQMLIAVALDETTQLVNYCRDHRIKSLLKHTRLLRTCVEEYTAEQQRDYGPMFASFTAYVAEFFNLIAADRVRIWFSLGNVTNAQIPAGRDRDLATRICIIHSLINKAEEFDKRADRAIAKKLGKPVYRKQNSLLKVITAMCMAIEDDFELKIELNDLTSSYFNVIANRAVLLSDKLVEQELAKVSKC